MNESLVFGGEEKIIYIYIYIYIYIHIHIYIIYVYMDWLVGWLLSFMAYKLLQVI